MIHFLKSRYDMGVVSHFIISVLTHLPLMIFSFIVMSYSHFILMWDARNYFVNWIFPLVELKNFDWCFWDCNQHGAFSYSLLYSFLQYFDLRNTVFIHFTTLSIMLVGFLYFGWLLAYLFKKKSWVFIGLACLCFNPAILANAINPTPDLLVFVFSLPCLYYLLTQKLYRAAFCGFLLLFSKEVGVIYYALSCFFYVCFLRRDQSIASIVYRLSWPFLAYFLLIDLRVLSQMDSLFQGSSISVLFTHLFKKPDIYFYSALKLIALLNFQWVLVGTIFISGIVALLSFCIPKYRKFFSAEMLYLIAVLGSLVWVICHYPTYSNVRYFLLVFPLSTLLFIKVLQPLSHKIVIPFTASLLGLLLMSCFFTIDPLSKRAYGVFSFGQHELLNMTSPTQECCGYGRDQLIYNLQYAKFIGLLNAFSQQVHLEKNDLMIVQPLVNYFLFANIDDHYYRWTLRTKGVHQPYLAQTVEEAKILDQKQSISRIFYISFPNIRADAFESNLFKVFKINSQVTLNDGGYSMIAYQLTS